ncbi:MAG: PAS domain-containing protein, partial [Pseudomonadota bacterium]
MLEQILRYVFGPCLGVVNTESVKFGSSSPVDEEGIDYRVLFENAAAGIGRTRVETGQVLLANPRLAKMFGYDDVDQFKAEYNFSEHYPEPDGRERQFEFYRNQPGELVQACFTDRYGELVYVESEVSLDPAGQYLDFVAIDVTEREKARLRSQRLESMIDSIIHQSKIPMSLKDLNNRYIYVSPAYTKYINKTVSEVEGKTAEELLGTEATRLLREADQDVIDRGKALELEQSFPIRLGNSTLQLYKFPIFDENNNVEGVATIGLDITQSEKDKRELARAKTELEEHRERLSLEIEQRTRELLERDELIRSFYDVVPDVFMITEAE